MITNKWIFTVFSVKDLFCFAQANGFSHVWVLSCFFMLVLCENEMSCGANKCPLFCVSNVIILQINVCKGLVIFGKGKCLSSLCEPNYDYYFCQLFEGLTRITSHEKDLMLYFICFGTYSTVSIFHCGPILVLTII